MSQSPLGRQRSVLVVGSGLTAAATAGFLDQAGLDPVVASTPEGTTPTAGTVLWRPGLVLLERLGIRRPAERLGTRLDSRHCLTADRSWTTDSDNRPSLLAVDDRRLGELIDEYVLAGVRVTDRSVTAVESTAGGVRATFEGAVTEPFDAVVTTTPLLAERPEASTAVHSWRFEWPGTLPAPPGPAEAWTERRGALFGPVAEGFHVRLISTAAVDAAAALSLDELDRRFGRLLEFPITAADKSSVADRSSATDKPRGPFTALDQRDLRYRRSRLQTPTTIADSGIVRVGSAARGSVPGDPLAAALGIEDGWVLADALAYGPDDVGSALADYERRRRQRERVLAAAIDEGSETPPVDRSPPLSHLAARRRLAFSHVHDGQPHPLAASIPQQL